MKLHPLNYLNLIFWFTILVAPFLLQTVGVIDTNAWSTAKENGVLSILTGSFLHGSFGHLMGNLSLIVLTTALLLNFQKKMYFQVVALGLLIPPILPYMLDMRVLGISGLAYTLLWYLIFRGIMSRDWMRFMIGVLLLVLYGDTAMLIVPNPKYPKISWISHLVGFILAFNLAFFQLVRSWVTLQVKIRFYRNQ